MAQAECPRCAAERWEWRVRVVMYVALGLATVTSAGPFCYFGTRGTIVPGLCLTAAFACLALGLSAIALYLTRRPATARPPPAADPLAHYRDGGPPECPRHPFAR